MFKRMVIVLFLGISSGVLLAQESYLGVYAFAHGTTSVDDEIVGFAPQSVLRFEVSVANEEGSEELFLRAGVGGALAIELRHDGEPVSPQALALAWSERTEPYAFFGGLPPEPSEVGILEPGVGLKTEVAIRQASGEAFTAGRYEVRFVVVPDAVTGPDGTPWKGRGGLAGPRFDLRTADTDALRRLERKILGNEALSQGDYRKASSYFAEVVEMDDSDLDGWAGLGVASFHLDDHARAVACLDKVMPSLMNKHLRTTLPLLLAESYVVLGEAGKAAETLRLVVAEHEVEPTLVRLQAKVALRSGND